VAPAFTGCGKTHNFVIPRRAARRGISLFLGFNQREIPRFPRYDKINYFFRKLFRRASVNSAPSSTTLPDVALLAQKHFWRPHSAYNNGMQRKVFWTTFSVLGLVADLALPFWWAIGATIPLAWLSWWIAYRSDWF